MQKLLLAVFLQFALFNAQSMAELAFKQYELKYKKTYASEAERQYRFDIFEKNYEKIQAAATQGNAIDPLNPNAPLAPTKTYTQELNQFADISDEEFAKKYLLPEDFFDAGKFASVYGTRANQSTKGRLLQNIPRSADWRPFATPAPNQESCNSCYAFAANGALETWTRKLNNEAVQLSTQEIIDCSTENVECVGGQPFAVLDYIVKNQISFASNYPYAGAKNSNCWVKEGGPANPEKILLGSALDLPEDPAADPQADTGADEEPAPEPQAAPQAAPLLGTAFDMNSYSQMYNQPNAAQKPPQPNYYYYPVSTYQYPGLPASTYQIPSLPANIYQYPGYPANYQYPSLPANFQYPTLPANVYQYPTAPANNYQYPGLPSNYNFYPVYNYPAPAPTPAPEPKKNVKNNKKPQPAKPKPVFPSPKNQPTPPPPPVVQPPVIQPPVIQPPVIQPPVIRPPVVQPPVIQPPVVQPPVVQPPVIQPPVVQPPVVQPTNPPIERPRPNIPPPTPTPDQQPVTPPVTQPTNPPFERPKPNIPPPASTPDQPTQPIVLPPPSQPVVNPPKPTTPPANPNAPAANPLPVEPTKPRPVTPSNSAFGKPKWGRLKKYRFVANNVLALLTELAKGPVAIAQHVSNELKFYKTGVYDGEGCTATSKPNHAALAMGYNLDATPPYIIVRNSWSRDWGEDGYFRIAIGEVSATATGTCLIAATNYNVVPEF